MTTKYRVSFDEDETEALIMLSYSELRGPSEQAHYIVKQELIKRGLLISVYSSWIDAKDRLPRDETTNVLCYGGGDIYVGHRDGHVLIPTLNDTITFHTPTHWMMLPPPPMDEEL